MAPERPAATFIALRAATLGIDDLGRQQLRAWLDDAVDARGAFVGVPVQEDALLRLFGAAIATLTDAERLAYRRWVLRWSDFTGRVITPHEHEARLEEIRRTRIERKH